MHLHFAGLPIVSVGGFIWFAFFFSCLPAFRIRRLAGVPCSPFMWFTGLSGPPFFRFAGSAVFPPHCRFSRFAGFCWFRLAGFPPDPPVGASGSNLQRFFFGASGPVRTSGSNLLAGSPVRLTKGIFVSSCLNLWASLALVFVAAQAHLASTWSGSSKCVTQAFPSVVCKRLKGILAMASGWHELGNHLAIAWQSLGNCLAILWQSVNFVGNRPLVVSGWQKRGRFHQNSLLKFPPECFLNLFILKSKKVGGKLRKMPRG